MDLGLKDRVAIVAASSRGLGKACATELAREGATVVICARGRAQLQATADEIGQETGTQVLPITADLDLDLRRHPVAESSGPVAGHHHATQRGRLGQLDLDPTGAIPSDPTVVIAIAPIIQMLDFVYGIPANTGGGGDLRTRRPCAVPQGAALRLEGQQARQKAL